MPNLIPTVEYFSKSFLGNLMKYCVPFEIAVYNDVWRNKKYTQGKNFIDAKKRTSVITISYTI